MMPAFVVVAAVQAAACHTIAADRIYARDLAAVAPVFSSLQPNLELGLAPAPGQTRIFHPGDLRRIALAHQIQADFSSDICFAWQMAVPTRAAILASIDKTLAGRKAQVELVDQSLASAPAGELVFPLAGLSGVSEQALTWRGYVRYAEDKQYMIWARVRVRVKENHILPVEPLPPDLVITADEVREEHYEGPLLHEGVLTNLSSVLGMVPRRPLAAGLPLMDKDLDAPRAVERGDTVQVIAEEGLARIEAQGIAEDGGRRGAIISVKNSTSGKKFRARIEDKDKVLVIPGTSSGLAVEEKKL